MEEKLFENIVFEGRRRYYKEDLTERDYTLECTTPYKLEIMGRVIEEHAWGKLLCEVARLLLELFPCFADKLLDFRCGWSDAPMFAKQQKTNFKAVSGGFYINCNHTAQHSCWFLQDLLDFLEIDKSGVRFLIRRPSSAEPKEVKEYFEQKVKQEFIEYICAEHGKNEENAIKIIDNIENCLNPMLKSISKSYDNFVLFDDYYVMLNYIIRIREKITSNLRYDEKIRKAVIKYFDYLIGYYKQ